MGPEYEPDAPPPPEADAPWELAKTPESPEGAELDPVWEVVEPGSTAPPQAIAASAQTAEKNGRLGLRFVMFMPLLEWSDTEILSGHASTRKTWANLIDLRWHRDRPPHRSTAQPRDDPDAEDGEGRGLWKLATPTRRAATVLGVR